MATSLDLYAGLQDDTILISNIPLVADLEVFARGGSDTITIWNVEAFATISVFGDDPMLPGGADILTVGLGDLANMAGNILFDGMSASDRLILDDWQAKEPRHLVFQAGVVTSPSSFGQVTHTMFVEDVQFKGGPFDDVVQIESLDFRVDLEAFGNKGNDTFLLADASHDLDKIRGDVLVHGESGFILGQDSGPSVEDDRLFVYDDQNAADTSRFRVNTLVGGLYGSITKLTGKSGEPILSLTYDQLEKTTLHANDGDNRIDVLAMPLFNALTVHAEGGDDTIEIESTPADTEPMQIFGGPGAEHIEVSPTLRNLGNLGSTLFIDGGAGQAGEQDLLETLDTNSGNTAPYTLSSTQLSRLGSAGVIYQSIELLTTRLSQEDNHMDVTSSAPGTTVLVLAFAGDDSLIAQNLASPVHFWGGADDDYATLMGTPVHDQVSVQGNVMTLGTGSLTTLSEGREFDGQRGVDVMTLIGVSGVDELFHIAPSTTRYMGRVLVAGQSPLDYRRAEQVIVKGNAGENDSLQVDGRTHPAAIGGGANRDNFSIQLGAAGTASDPLMVLYDEYGRDFLTVQDFRDVGTPRINGLLGEDTYRVTIGPTAPVDRQILLDGGSQPNGTSDRLYLGYQAEGADFSWNPTSDSSGEIDVEYADLLFQVAYEEVEFWKWLPW